jgi:hypothetical protein
MFKFLPFCILFLILCPSFLGVSSSVKIKKEIFLQIAEEATTSYEVSTEELLPESDASYFFHVVTFDISYPQYIAMAPQSFQDDLLRPPVA